MVDVAIAHFDQKGLAALDDFNRAEASAFKNDEMHVVVQSTGPDAKIVAHAGNPELVGEPLSEIVNAQGRSIATKISDNATAEGDLFQYDWLNQARGRVEKKISWAVRHKDLVFIVGFFR
jgi:signal transduction histidine kinase